MNVWLKRLCLSLHASLQTRELIEKGKWLINSYIKGLLTKKYSFCCINIFTTINIKQSKYNKNKKKYVSLSSHVDSLQN